MRCARPAAVVAGALAAAVLAAGCGGAAAGEDDGRLDVVAGFYPLAFAAERVGADRVDVTDVTPPGVEPHDLELDPDRVELVQSADVVLVAGGFQPAVEDAARDAGGTVVDVLDGMPLVDGDPHVWLDPVLMADLVAAVRDALAAADPGGDAAYRGAADRLLADLDALDGELAAGLDGCDGELLVTTHGAFGYLARRYGLDAEGITGLAPEGDVDPARFADLADLVVARGVHTVFTEALAPAELAETLAAETGAATAVLDPVEGLAEDGGDADYLSVMRANLAALRDGLGCGAP